MRYLIGCIGAGDDNQIVLCELGLSTSTKTNPKATYVSLKNSKYSILVTRPKLRVNSQSNGTNNFIRNG
jgi:hypothetical protein